MNHVLLLILCIVIGFLPGIIGSALGSRNKDDPKQAWYDRYKPSFTPPAIVFPIVWTILYALIGISLFFVVSSKSLGPKQYPVIIGVFAANLVLNALWSPLFFRLGALTWALIVAIGLLVTALYLVFALARSSLYAAAALLAPYAMWLSFALVLNTTFVINKAKH